MSSFSNYYIKLNMNSEHGDGVDDELSVKVPVEHDNVFTVCPICGEEHQIDLTEVCGDSFDFYGTSVYCEKCSELYRKSHETEEVTRR